MAGKRQWYDEIITLAGGVNAFEDEGIQFPSLSAEGLLRLNPDVIIEMAPDLNSQPYSEEDVVREWSILPTLKAVREGRVYVLGKGYATIPGPRFVDNGDGTVTDNQTGLMWEQKTVGNVNDTFDWAEAFAYVHGFSDRSVTPPYGGVQGLGSHADWRLPSHTELQTILLAPFPCGTNPCIDPIFGPTASDYWSSTTDPFFPPDAWGVNFDNGNVHGGNKDFDDHVRAVRGGS